MSRPTNALIVDDEPHVRLFLRMLLREIGITETWEAGDGATAIERVAEHQPQVVLLDINLPVMGGMKVLAHLKQEQPDLPVIMVTSQSAMGSVQEAARLGASGYVLKHNSREQALEMLREAIDSLDDPGEPGTD